MLPSFLAAVPSDLAKHRRSSNASIARGGALAAWLALLLAACTGIGCARGVASPQAAVSRDASPGAGRPDEQLQEPRSRVIVRLRPEAAGQDLAGSYSTVVLGSVHELDLQLLRLPAGATEQGFLRSLQSDWRVLFAEPDFQLQTAEGRQSVIAFSEGLRAWTDVLDQSAMLRIGVPEAHALARGRDVLVAVLDTGVDLDHPALAARLALPGFEPGVTASPGDDRVEALDTNEDGLIDGSWGHGTHVAGIVLAIAPEARVLPVRVLDSDGVGYAFAVARGLLAAVTRGAHIANLSLGMPVTSLAVEAAVEYATAAGVLVAAPAGNGGAPAVEFPASSLLAIAVAGTDADDQRAGFSNYSSAVDLAAPAVGILSAYPGGGCATWSGTSMATPFAAGVAALAYEMLGVRSVVGRGQVELALRRGALPLGTEGQEVTGLGAGRVRASASLQVLMGGSGGGVGGPSEEVHDLP